MDLSLVIAPYHRAHGLSHMLETLLAQDTPSSLAWEIVVVDNNSTDATAAAVKGFDGRGPVSVRYLFEPRQGKIFAVNSGIGDAKGEVLAFTDDDVFLRPDWVVTL